VAIRLFWECVEQVIKNAMMDTPAERKSPEIKRKQEVGYKN
jgi:hypothetical protein